MINIAEKEIVMLKKEILQEEAHAILQLYQEEKANHTLLEIIKEDLHLKKLELKEFYHKCFIKHPAFLQMHG